MLLCKNETGYKNLIKMVSAGFTEGFYSKPRVDKELLEKYHEGLICLSACLAGEVPQAILAGDYERAKQTALYFRDLFGAGNYYLELQDHGLEEDSVVLPQLIRLARETGIPMVATNDAHYISRDDAKMQSILLCIQTGKTIADADRMAWFASTRRQPEGKACVYAFVPAASRENYNADEMEHKQLVALADLTRISDTWTKPEKRAKEMQRLNRLHANADHTSTAATELAFVVNDATTYTRPEQFHSDETRRTYFEVIRLTNSLKTDMAKLEKMRLKYHNAPSSERTFVGKQIEKLEQIVNQTRDTLRQTERELRIKENNILGNK